MIERKLHFVWLGGSPRGAILGRCLRSFHEHCPGFEIEEWNESRIPRDPYLEFCLERRRWANASNYLRLWILHEHGGIYVDTDMEVLRPLDDLLETDFFAGFEGVGLCRVGEWLPDREVAIVNNAIMGSRKRNPFLARCLSQYSRIFDGGEAANLSGPHFMTYMLAGDGLPLAGWAVERDLRRGEVTIHARERFYPIGWDGSGEVGAASFTLHHWMASWQR
ncbi:MAG: hypothetical protein HY720_16065 [Planctomycetes bacterium]|nr:hypothetical protein [Planctomycetota bacterium]